MRLDAFIRSRNEQGRLLKDPPQLIEVLGDSSPDPIETRPPDRAWTTSGGTQQDEVHRLGILFAVLTEFLMEDGGDGWWHCPSPLHCEVLDGPASNPLILGSSPVYLVRTDPLIEWHGEPQHREFWGPDHPLGHPMDPTPFALVMARAEQPIRPDLGIIDGGLPAGPALPSPEPTTVGEAETISGLWVKVILRVAP